MTFFDHTLKDIGGHDKALGDYAGKVVLAVNVASACGATPQYAGLEKLYEEFKDKGLVVMGFPSNDFGAQEPGTEAEIQAFCTTRFDVKFPMFSKLKVKGEGKHPLYGFLTQHAAPTGEVQWNFEKFLIGRDGRVIGRFGTRVTPEAPELRDAITAALG